MKTNKGFASLLIILAIVFIAGVSTGSYYLGKHSVDKIKNQTYSDPDAQGMENDAKDDLEKNNINSTNKLFEFFNTFTSDKNRATPSIKFMNPDENLIVLDYWTGSETNSYAVYDYKNNILYKDIGGEGIGGGSHPEAFVGNNKILVYSEDDFGKSSITIQDFNNKIIKTILTNTPLYEVYPKFGKIITIDINQKSSGRYLLNTETLELTPWNYVQEPGIYN